MEDTNRKLRIIKLTTNFHYFFRLHKNTFLKE